MFSQDFRALEPSGRHAVDGFSAIVDALDRGSIPAATTGGATFSDIVAIALGWAVLLAVIEYPALQLAAIFAAAVLLSLRSSVRFIRGAWARPI